MVIEKTDELIDNGCHPFTTERRILVNEIVEEKPSMECCNNNITSTISNLMGLVWGMIMFGIVIGIGFMIMKSFTSVTSANGLAGLLLK